MGPLDLVTLVDYLPNLARPSPLLTTTPSARFIFPQIFGCSERRSKRPSFCPGVKTKIGTPADMTASWVTTRVRPLKAFWIRNSPAVFLTMPQRQWGRPVSGAFWDVASAFTFTVQQNSDSGVRVAGPGRRNGTGNASQSYLEAFTNTYHGSAASRSGPRRREEGDQPRRGWWGQVGGTLDEQSGNLYASLSTSSNRDMSWSSSGARGSPLVSLERSGLTLRISAVPHGFNRLDHLRYDIENLGEWTRKCGRKKSDITDHGRYNESGIPSSAGGVVEVIWVYWLRRSCDREESLDGGNDNWTLRLLGEKNLLEGMGCGGLDRGRGGARGWKEVRGSARQCKAV
ncbi:hypothetical protein BS47DRAFT_1364917 [Hydnum rufescens UP504]|uniref:Uncharacterized protein n=1 Tax=Hydnum rufescens UP504 TaxID=1448309 RepID=A0A9P6DQD6_9AGAM|nr:hypothetical protein BS47DRAFT_1364917 [Hydnum rufescens UP504]